MTPEQIKTMSPAEVAKHLAEHNKWHRGKGKYSKCSLSPHDPYDLGLIIDRAIELLKEKTMGEIVQNSEQYSRTGETT